MPHPRQTIRESVATAVTGLATTGARVYQSRLYNVQDNELPCLIIYSLLEEIAELEAMGSPCTLRRELQLVIEAKAKATANLDDTLDTIASEVEAVIGADPSLAGLVERMTLQDTETTLGAEGDQPTGNMALRYLVNYSTNEDLS